jgi:2'-5' RNA ligase
MREILEHVFKILENDGKHEYSLVKVEVPKELTEMVLAFGLNIPDDQIYEDPDDTSLGRELETHITVKYGLETQDPAEVEKIIAEYPEPDDIAPIDVKLGNTAIFESDKPYDVVYISAESAQLNKLHELLNSLPNGDEHPNYIAHVCIAYVKKGNGKQYIDKTDFNGLEFEVNEVVFKTPTGDSTKINL